MTIPFIEGSLPEFATNFRHDSESPTSSATTRIPGTFLHRPKITTFRQTLTRIYHDFKYLFRFTILLNPITHIPDRPPRIPISGRSLLRFVNLRFAKCQNRYLFRIHSKFTHIRMLLPHLAGPVVSRIRCIFHSRITRSPLVGGTSHGFPLICGADSQNRQLSHVRRRCGSATSRKVLCF